jgi:hypothetical protein
MGSGFPVAVMSKCISPSEEDDFMLYVCNDSSVFQRLLKKLKLILFNMILANLFAETFMQLA